MKKKLALLISVLIFSTLAINAQNKLITRNGKIKIFSKTTVENIDGENNEVLSLLDPQNKEIAFQVLITGFKFEKALMQEHFNENYMESSKYPKASFKGVFKEPSKIDFNKDGKYEVPISGELTIHGVAKKIEINSIIIIAGKKVSGQSKFNVKLGDYKIVVPSLVAEQISESIAISVNCNYDPYSR
jgi:hypothetical protein